MRGELKNILLGSGILLLIGVGTVFYQTLTKVSPLLKNEKTDNVAAVSSFNSSPSEYREDLTILVGTSTLLKLEVATTSQTLERGLSGRKTLPQDQGLLFIFPEAKFYGFWMKEMNFAIDIIWLDEEGVVVEMTKNLSPNTYPDIFYPPTPIKYVIEVKAGFTNSQKLEVGDVFSPLPTF